MNPDVSVVPRDPAQEFQTEVLAPRNPKKGLGARLKDFILRRKQTSPAMASVVRPNNSGDVIDIATASRMFRESQVSVGRNYNNNTEVGVYRPTGSRLPITMPRPMASATPLMGALRASAQNSYATPTPATNNVTLDSFMRALSGQESGGNYNVANKDTGAHGKYQIMPANWPSWSQEAGLPAGAAKTPENQERVTRFKLQQYYNKYGNWEDVASAWYSGRPLNKVNADVKQGNYPSIREYVNSVVKKAGG